MPSEVLTWLEHNADRTLAAQRARVDTVKLVVTFSAGVATTLVATEMQVEKNPRTIEYVAVGLLVCSLLLAFLAIALDRTADVNVEELLVLAGALHWSEQTIVSELKLRLVASAKTNVTQVRVIQVVGVVQVLLSVGVCIVALVALLTASD